MSDPIHDIQKAIEDMEASRRALLASVPLDQALALSALIAGDASLRSQDGGRRPAMTDPIGYLETVDGPELVYAHDATGLSPSSLVQIGETVASLNDWAQAIGLGRETLRQRLVEQGVSALDALRPSPSIADTQVPYEEDIAAQVFVAQHPHPIGATLAEVGEHFGLTRERIRQIETVALGKLERALRREDFDVETFLYAMQQRTDQWDGLHVDDTRARLGTARGAIMQALRDGEWWRAVDVARFANRTRTNVSNRLSAMAKAGEIEQKREGRLVYYRLSGASEQAA